MWDTTDLDLPAHREVPAWSRLSAAGGLGKGQLAPAIIFFALLCWINCVGIEKWEGGNLYAPTRWASLHLRSIVTMIALFSLTAAPLASDHPFALSGFRLDYRASRARTPRLRDGFVPPRPRPQPRAPLPGWPIVYPGMEGASFLTAEHS
jgi:hypothetical protein